MSTLFPSNIGLLPFMSNLRGGGGGGGGAKLDFTIFISIAAQHYKCNYKLVINSLDGYAVVVVRLIACLSDLLPHTTKMRGFRNFHNCIAFHQFHSCAAL